MALDAVQRMRVPPSEMPVSVRVGLKRNSGHPVPVTKPAASSVAAGVAVGPRLAECCQRGPFPSDTAPGRALAALRWNCGPTRKRRHRAPLLVRDGGPLVCLTLQQLCQMCRKCFLPLLATHVTLPSHRTQWSPWSPLFTCSVVSHPSGGSTKDLCMRSRSGRNVRCVRRT